MGIFSPGLMGSFLIVAIGEWILAGILNVVYLARKVIILLLLVLGMVAIYSLMFSKTRAFFGNWFRELLGNVFLQSIHAIVFYGMVMFAEMGASVFF
ncbi:type IV secretion system protein (plasmid) [Lysinibacillus sp. MHQ-1]|nr:type IV secretion system protein [Lysinibacillus sp. MHQ-1]